MWEQRSKANGQIRTRRLARPDMRGGQPQRMPSEREVCRVRPRVLFAVGSRECLACGSLVERDQVIILVQSWVAELGVEPCGVEEEGVQKDDGGLIGVEAT